MILRYFFILLAGSFISCGKPVAELIVDSASYINPLLPYGPDPYVFQKDSFYYYTNTLSNRIEIWKTKSISRLSAAKSRTVWEPQPGRLNSYALWAPELYFFEDKWYLYYAAGNTPDRRNQRLFVLENSSEDPWEGEWIDKGKIADPVEDIYAIDATVLEFKKERYLIWSSLPVNNLNKQCLFIAKMKNPWSLETKRVMISSPEYDWEKVGSSDGVNEGPEVLINPEGRVFLAFGASNCGTDSYGLGILSLKENGDPLKPSDWSKLPQPVLQTWPASSAYGPGHSAFFKSPDRKENWIIYHANSKPNEMCGSSRSPRIQKFTWNTEGLPVFGNPVPISALLVRPSGEKE